MSDEDIGLAIDRYESAFLANIVASCLFELTDAHFTKAIIRGIYHDGGLVVSKCCQTPRQIRQWLKRFQCIINNITGGHLPPIYHRSVESTNAKQALSQR
eukprot:6564976-Ditylum_brightwellii.AAC.1